MSGRFRKGMVLVLCEALVLMPLMTARAGQAGAETSSSAAEAASLRDYLQKPYVELFEVAPKLAFTTAEIEQQRKGLQKGEDFCVNQFKTHAKNYNKQIAAAQKELKQNTQKITDAERKDLHCQIQNLELLRSEAEVLSRNAIPTAYDNLTAKLDLIQKWPATHKEIEQQIANGSYNQRRWGDVKDIGFREIAAGQEDDIRRGQEAIQQMKQAGIMPKDLPDKGIQEYVNSVAQRIATHSDLKIPLHCTVLQSREANAFALPGGYIFVQRGLLEEADDESELAGVLAHEISHDVARHSSKLMKRATIASIFYQAAQVAAVVLTGGIAGIGMYYALQYGFYGLGLVLSLQLLGVSRDYELEADQLGVQYAWNAGYDPSGFTRFFDKMATRAGYVNSVSWFRTHPPFYQRMVDTQREIAFLPKKESLILQTTAFENMKKALKPVAAEAEKEEVGKPSLRITREQGCAPPQKLEYKPNQPIEDLCAAASQNNQK
ncbi:MAG TPA: M48 family metalloprotease [Terriglobia bacterium]|nr:M48 family metalloprotease [Terriglobia bacterium]